MIKRDGTTPQEISLEDRRAQAAGQYDATYARNVDMADKYIAIWTKIFPTVWVEGKDRAGYIDAVVKAKGGTVYVSVHMRKNKASDPYAHGTANDVSDPQSFWVTSTSPRTPQARHPSTMQKTANSDIRATTNMRSNSLTPLPPKQVWSHTWC